MSTHLRSLLSLSNVPVAAGGVALVCWLFASNGLYVTDPDPGVVLNPVSYLSSMVLHANPGHFASNVRWWLPLAVVFTLLTSNRHLLLVAVVSHVLTQIASTGLFRFGSGLSVAVFAVLTAMLVRSVGYAFQDYSAETLQNAVAILLVPLLAGVFLVVVLAGPSQVGHLEHFLGALFGAGIETMYVISGHEPDEAADGAPERVV